MHTGFWCGDLKERDHSEDLGVDGRIVIIKGIFQEMGLGMDWNDLAQVMDTWLAVVNAVINFRVLFHAKIS